MWVRERRQTSGLVPEAAFAPGGAGIPTPHGKTWFGRKLRPDPSLEVAKKCPREGPAWQEKPGQTAASARLVQGHRRGLWPGRSPRTISSFFRNTFSEVAEVLADSGNVENKNTSLSLRN